MTFFKPASGIMAVISLMIAIALFATYSANQPPSEGDGWKVTAIQKGVPIPEGGRIPGGIRIVWVDPDRYEDEEFMSGILEALAGRYYENHNGEIDIYFFEHLGSTPTEIPDFESVPDDRRYPFSDEQLLHLCAEYHYAMPDQSWFYYVWPVDPDVSPPELEREQAWIYPGKSEPHTMAY